MTDKSPPSAANSAQFYDELLITRAQGGDRKAADLLARRWHPRLVRTARRYLNDGDQAEQLAQDCWIGIWRGIGRLQDPASFGPWAFTILRKKSTDVIRRAVTHRANFEDSEEPHELPQPAPQEDSTAITQAFAQLPRDQRLAAHLHFVEGLTLREIAQVQQIPEGTAKSRLFHARGKLKAALQPSNTHTNQGENP